MNEEKKNVYRGNTIKMYETLDIMGDRNNFDTFRSDNLRDTTENLNIYMEGEIVNLRKEIQQKESENEILLNKHKDLEKVIEDKQSKITKLEKDNSNLDSEITSKNCDINSLKAHEIELKNEIENKEEQC
jgi:chromosome segregation ATPase